MPQEIRISYEEVYEKAAELRTRLTTELRELDTAYRQAQMTLRGLDSRTNAVYTEAMEANRIKARVTAETLEKLISFIESSTRQVERDETTISRAFTRSRVSPARRR